jgi:glycosyltransferase involved in cell wall biosynthesis
MRIGLNTLFLVPGAVGGSETYARSLVTHLGRIDRHNQYLLFTNRENSDTFGLAGGNFQEIICPIKASFRPTRILWEQVVLPFQARRHRIDVLHSLGYTAPVMAPCRSVVTIYDLNFLRHPEDFSRISALTLRALVPLAARRSDHIITLSENSLREIVSSLRVSREKVSVTYPAANQYGARLESTDAKQIRQVYGIHGRFILTVAASHPHKNLRRLLEAYKILRTKYSTEHQLVMVGLKGRDHTRLLKSIAVLSLQGKAVATGWIPAASLASLYGAADVFVFPSLYEGFGLPVLEAMEHGIPVVSSNVPSLCEAAGDATIAVDPYDEESMAAAVHRVLVDQALRESLIEKGYQHSSSFSWEKTARQTLAVYEGQPVDQTLETEVDGAVSR